MAFTVTETDREKYLEMALVGKVEYGSGESLYPGLIAVMDKHPDSLYLVDVTGLIGRPDVLQSLQTIEFIPSEKIQRVRKMAVVDKATNRATVLVAEAAMAQRGLRIRFFFERESAVEWLLV